MNSVPEISSLKSAGVNILSRKYCREHAEEGNQIQNLKIDEFCAGTPDNDGDGYLDAGKDTCIGKGIIQLLLWRG